MARWQVVLARPTCASGCWTYVASTAQTCCQRVGNYTAMNELGADSVFPGEQRPRPKTSSHVAALHRESTSTTNRCTSSNHTEPNPRLNSTVEHWHAYTTCPLVATSEGTLSSGALALLAERRWDDWAATCCRASAACTDSKPALAALSEWLRPPLLGDASACTVNDIGITALPELETADDRRFNCSTADACRTAVLTAILLTMLFTTPAV